MEALTTGSLEKIGFWGLLAIYVLRDGIIPMFNKYIPSRIKLTEREQDRQDKKQSFEQQMELRHVEALEKISNILVLHDDKLNRLHAGQDEIMRRLPRQTKRKTK